MRGFLKREVWDFSLLWMDEGKVWNLAEWKAMEERSATGRNCQRCWVAVRKKALCKPEIETMQRGQFQTCVCVYYVCLCVFAYFVCKSRFLVSQEKGIPLPTLQWWGGLGSSTVLGEACAVLRVSIPTSMLLPRPDPHPSSTFPTWSLKAFGFAATVLKFYLGFGGEEPCTFFIWGSPAHSLGLSRF